MKYFFICIFLFINFFSNAQNEGNLSWEPEMIFVEGDSFLCGKSDEKLSSCGETIPYMVSVESFYISKFEITEDVWGRVMGDYNNNLKGSYKPISNISWFDLLIFIKKLNNRTKKNYRIPSAFEWEFAARGGKKTNHYKFAGSNILNEVSWNVWNSNDSIHPIGLKKPNELGIYDMSGNVWEFTCKYDSGSTIMKDFSNYKDWYCIKGGSYSSPEKKYYDVAYGLLSKEYYVKEKNVGIRLILDK